MLQELVATLLRGTPLAVLKMHRLNTKVGLITFIKLPNGPCKYMINDLEMIFVQMNNFDPI